VENLPEWQFLHFCGCWNQGCDDTRPTMRNRSWFKPTTLMVNVSILPARSEVVLSFAGIVEIFLIADGTQDQLKTNSIEFASG